MKRGWKRRWAAVATVLCLVAVGCGGNETKPEDAVSTYFEALAAGDGERACSQLTVDTRRAAVDLFEQQARTQERVGCEEVISELSKSFSKDEKARLRNVEIARSEENGDTAEVQVLGAAETAPLKRSGDQWLISGGLFSAQETGSSAGTPETTKPDPGGSSSGGSGDRERKLERILSDFESFGYLDVTVSHGAATVTVREGATRSDADVLCGIATGAIDYTGIPPSSIVIVSNDHGRDSKLASC